MIGCCKARTVTVNLSYYRTHIAGCKIPRQLLLVQAIPLTASGKPDAKVAQAPF
jgi:acyl-CoA synthetase (AMP-forming)/AMP-acid ligase II